MRDAIVSTHFDDAALSLFSVLQEAAERAVVITVCGGLPSGTDCSAWDAAAGFRSGGEAASARRLENALSCAVTGARAVDLPFVDGPYAEIDRRAVHDAIQAELAPGDRVWIPAGIGEHPDHLVVRGALADLATHVYADGGYASRHGWERWDRRRPRPWRWRSHVSGLGPTAVRTLDDATMADKLRAVRAHASQLAGLADGFPRLLDHDGPLRREQWWEARTLPVGR